MTTRTVSTKEELKQAKKDAVDEIIVVGKLAQHIKIAKRVMTLGPIALAAIGVALASIPMTGGLSVAALAPAATATGGSAVAIAIIAVGGIVFAIALFRDYDIDFAACPDGRFHARLTKKK